MTERLEERERPCNKCEQKIVTTSTGIKLHEANCSGKV